MAAHSSAVSAPPSRFLSSANSLRMHSVLSSRSLLEKFKCGPQYRPVECTTGLKSPVRFHVSGYKPLNSPAQPASSLLHCFIQCTLELFVCGNVVGDSVESLAKFKVNNFYCFPIDSMQLCARAWLELCKKNIMNFVK